MKKLKVGINGFGRIGRAIYRINHLKDLFDVVVINDINPDNKNIAYLLEYDTTYGRFGSEVSSDENSMYHDDKKIDIYHEKNIIDVPWDKLGVDIVIESSGVSANVDAIKANINSLKVKNFIVTHAADKDFKTIIFGVNEKELHPKKHRLISSSICDTISLAPIINTIQKTYTIKSGFLTTLHPYLGYQNLLDGPSKSWSQPGDVYSHYSLGRASMNNLIPKSTSAVRAADSVFEGLSTKLQSFSYRVPTSIVSSAVLIVHVDKDLELEKLRDSFYEFEKEQKYKVIKNSTKPLVSLDYAKEEYSAIIDHRWTQVENSNLLKLVYWYDNEWGYSNRVVDIVELLLLDAKDDEI